MRAPNTCSATRHVQRALVIALLAVALIGGVRGRPANAAFAGQNGKIAFESSRDGRAAIFAMGSDGSGLTKLSSGAANDGSPSWSADGSKIVFTTDRDG